jgi:hypothetical protein
MEFFYNYETTIFASLIFGIITYYSRTSHRERKWIKTKFGNNNIMALSFGVKCFGLASRPGKPQISSGFLLLTHDRLLYKSRAKRVEINIPVTDIIQVYHDNTHKGADLHQSVVKIIFSNSYAHKDSVAFKVPYPPQWIDAIKIRGADLDSKSNIPRFNS